MCVDKASSCVINTKNSVYECSYKIGPGIRANIDQVGQ